MLYSVNAVLGICCTHCQLVFMTQRDRERDNLILGSAMMVELRTRKREMGDEHKNGVDDMRGY